MGYAMIDITASDGFVFSAYRVDPAGTPKGAIVILQELFGVTQDIRSIVDSYAAQGYVAIAPCLFDRAKKGVELGFDAAAIAEGQGLVQQVGFENAMKDIQATVNLAGEAGKVALVGYDWGAYLGYHAANLVRGLACVIGYYGCGIATDPGPKRRTTTLLHFGTEDGYITREQVKIFRASRPDVSVFEYPGVGHGFGCEGRETYSEVAAVQALDRTMTLITHTIEGPPAVTLKNAGAYAAAKPDKKKKAASEDDLGPM